MNGAVTQKETCTISHMFLHRSEPDTLPEGLVWVGQMFKSHRKQATVRGSAPTEQCI